MTRITSVITATAQTTAPAEPRLGGCAVRANVATTIIVAHTSAGRNGCRIQKLPPPINRPSSRMARTVRVRSLDEAGCGHGGR